MSPKIIDNIKSGILVIQSDKQVIRPSYPLLILGSISIYVMIVPLLILDIFLFQYQEIFFSIFKIPKLKRSEYMIFDRGGLKKLTGLQKLNCIYCEYANGVLGFARAVAHQTEVYTCAIKHKSHVKDQEHQVNFYPSEDFE